MKQISGRSISPARIAAARALRLIETDASQHAAEALATCVAEAKLGPEDERLARSLVFGVLRTGLTMDSLYAPLLNQPVTKLHPAVKILLRMAAFQHFRLTRVPDYAIGQDTVELGKKVFHLKTPQVGFLNAVARKIVAVKEPREPPSGNRIADLAIRHSMPDFVARLLVDKYGTHKAAAIMEACADEPPMAVRVNQLRINRPELMAQLQSDGFEVREGLIAPDAVIIDVGPGGISLFETAAFREGLFYVQDEGSQMVAELVAPQAGETILDMCAAPGGKTTHMAELSGGRAHITATDLSPRRLAVVHTNIERLKSPNITVVTLADVVASNARYDAVLVDAPCSGLGTIRRNPEIRYRVNAELLQHQQVRQLDALRQAAPHVRPGGRLIYSTCSVSNEENLSVIAQFLEANPEFSLASGPESALLREDGFYATWPGLPFIDGFEAVVLRKS